MKFVTLLFEDNDFKRTEQLQESVVVAQNFFIALCEVVCQSFFVKRAVDIAEVAQNNQAVVVERAAISKDIGIFALNEFNRAVGKDLFTFAEAD